MLDEPAARQHDRETAELADFIRRLNAGGPSVVPVEHDISGVMSACRRGMVLTLGHTIADGRPAGDQADHAHVMEGGRIALSGPAAALAQDPRVAELYLGGHA